MPERRKKSRDNQERVVDVFLWVNRIGRESEPLKMRKVVWGRSSNQCSPLRRA